ncbi:BTB/POZ domain protein [Quillaja saponaria]|uniref:BTB/POZ domain protein n=1 Tax=Quillaja saponaria TaxID=32244 RepID=A0AAD7PGV1_QUISA|nr:BTB/POZ domain protein [Quillaja saponaria]
MALAYLYGHHPKLNNNNAFCVLSSASFLDLQDLCAICTDFIISELWTSNFLAYQVLASSQNYGIHGEHVRNACWGYLCQSGGMELKEELALHTFLVKCAQCKVTQSEQGSSGSESGNNTHSYSAKGKGKNVNNTCGNKRLESLSLKNDLKDHTACDLLVELADCVVDFQRGASNPNQQVQQDSNTVQSNLEPRCPCNAFIIGGMATTGVATEGPSDNESCYLLKNNSWLVRDQSKNCFSLNSSCNALIPNYWGRWCSLLYCNMSLEALLNVRRQLEESGFPCKAVNDGHWLQMLLSQRVQEIAVNACKNCCLTSMACNCRQPFGFSHGATATGYYVQEHDQNNSPGNVGNINVAESSQGEGNSRSRPVRVHVRGATDGLAGIGHGTTFVPAAGCPPTCFVFSRVPFRVGNRNYTQSLANDYSESQADHNGGLSCDGWTALVGISQGRSNGSNVHAEQTERGYEMDLQSRASGAATGEPSAGGIPMQMLDSPEHTIGIEIGSRITFKSFSSFSVWVMDAISYVRYQLICPSKREAMVFGSFRQTGTFLPKDPKGWGWRTALSFDELADRLQNGALRIAAVVQLV